MGAAISRQGVAASSRSSNPAVRGPPSSIASTSPLALFRRIVLAGSPRGVRTPPGEDTMVQAGWLRDGSEIPEDSLVHVRSAIAP